MRRNLGIRVRGVVGHAVAAFSVATLAVVGFGVVMSFGPLGAAPAGAATVTLSVHDFAFSPTPLTIPAGTTVTVTNSGPSTHTWSSDPGAAQQWNSGDIAPGGSFSITFTRAGTYTYHCNIHSFMTGTIVVTARAPATTATTPPNTATSPPATTPVAGATAPSAAAATPTTRATALPRTGASHSGVLVGSAAMITLVGVGLAVSGTRRRRRIT